VLVQRGNDKVGEPTVLVDGLLSRREQVLVGGQVLYIEALGTRNADDIGRGPNLSETMVQGMISHIRAITGGDFWGRSVNPRQSYRRRRITENEMDECREI
jgi:hypothetical protein